MSSIQSQVTPWPHLKGSADRPDASGIAKRAIAQPVGILPFVIVILLCRANYGLLTSAARYGQRVRKPASLKHASNSRKGDQKKMRRRNDHLRSRDLSLDSHGAMPRGIGNWRRRENSGRLVASRLREERRGPVSGRPKRRMKWITFRRSDSRGVLFRRFGATLRYAHFLSIGHLLVPLLPSARLRPDLSTAAR